jgi:hypothetical protein
MSTKTETADEKLRQYKRDLDARCLQWLDSHPEGAENIDTSDMLSRPQLTAGDEYRYENGTRPFADPEPKFQSALLPNGHLEKVVISEVLEGVWGVKVGDVLVDAFRGPNARQLALEKGEALADAQKRRF